MREYLSPRLDVLTIEKSDVITSSKGQQTLGDDNCKDWNFGQTEENL